MRHEVIREFQDRALAYLLSTPDHFFAYLRIVLPDVAAEVVPGSLRPLPTRLVTGTLHLREEDVAWCAVLRSGAEATFLLAHQSTVDPLMAFRLVLGRDLLLDGERRRLRAEGVAPSQQRLSPVVPLLVHTGAEPWDAPGFTALFQDDPTLERFATDPLEVVPLDLAVEPEERLAGVRHPVGYLLALLAARHAEAEEFLGAFRRARHRLEDWVRRTLPEARRQREALREHVWFCVQLARNSRSQEEWSMLEDEAARAVGPKEARTMARTMSEADREEGEVSLLTHQLRDRLGEEAEGLVARLRAADAEVRAEAARLVVRHRAKDRLRRALDRILPPV